MNRHALAVLEFPAVLALVADRASSALGAARIRSLMPSADPLWIAREHERIAALRELARDREGWTPPAIPDLTAALARLRVAGAGWRTGELLDGATLLRSGRIARTVLRDAAARGIAPQVLEEFAATLLAEPGLEAIIERAIDPDGSVRDEASPTLRRIRRELRGAESEIVRLLERLMSRLEPHHRVHDMSVTVRDGRYVIPIRREARSVVGGIVHGESNTGGTLFVEPPAAIEAGNRVRELQADETREVEHILARLTDALRPSHGALAQSLDTLVTLDALSARARFAEDFGCAPVQLAAPGAGFALRGGRHPLLVARGGSVVPFDLDMLPAERTLLLSGPNTGGKTVLLKAIGLLSILTQAGVPVPVSAGSRIPVYHDCFADIGDEQSIEASLSTFSAHVHTLGEILEHAGPRSLVLIDELGSGTDPAEGAALGGAVLEELTDRGTLTVATTHLGALKLLATGRAGVVNASLQFDDQALAPTYRLLKGIPGRSYGLSIARRLGLPAHVLARAEGRASREERDLAVLLAELERREVALGEREASAAADQADAAARRERVEERERAVRDAERSLERRAHEQARRLLLEARRQVDEAVREVRAGAGETEATRSARRRIEDLAAAHGAAAEEKAAEPAPASPGPGESASVRLAVGDAVAVAALDGRTGRVLELRGGEALVAVGSVKLTVPLGSLARPSTGAAPEEPVRLRGALPEAEPAREIDLRGMRVEEMEAALVQALDAASRSDLGELRVIHGKGTGALRERVAEVLRGDPRVHAHRHAAWNEGGTGVTIVDLRS